MKNTNNQLFTLKQLLDTAECNHFAIGSFSPRYTPVIRSILRAGEQTESPVIIQIAQVELERYGITPEEFASEVRIQLAQEQTSIPLGLHLDHTKKIEIIENAIASGFTSVMIDASDQELEENIAITRSVVEFAHARGVSVEAELGRLASADSIETDNNQEYYTDPNEVKYFVSKTNVDALAISIGTVHGVYPVHQPKIDLKRLRIIRKHTSVHLVLHGGSGNPSDVLRETINLPEGGISKINIATDLETALLKTLGRKEYMTNNEMKALPSEMMEKGLEVVQSVVVEKINSFLGSKQRSYLYTV